MSNNPVLIFTGGHHTSALEVAKCLQSRGWSIIWLGHKHSMWKDISVSAEYREVTEAGITFLELKAGKMHHTFHPLKLARVPYGFYQALSILRDLKKKYREDLKGVVTFGGYIGVPVTFAGWLLDLPVIAHEQTTTVGWANKFISVFARKIAVTWPSGSPVYPAGKVIFTGLPLRSEILQELKSPSPRENLIYITGGKQGSHAINQAVFPILEKLLTNFRVIHQTGSSSVFNDYQKAMGIKGRLPRALRDKYVIHEYLGALAAASALSTALVVISRSGAHITYELGLFKTKAVLIPIPWSSHNEQAKNAQVLVDNDQAVILPQSRLTSENLLSAIEQARLLVPGNLNLPVDGTEKMVRLIEDELIKK